MTYLRLVQSPPGVAPVAPDQACLDAFQRELDYIWRTLRRLGVPPSEIEDVAQDVFLALRASWTDYDQSRPRLRRRSGREVALGMIEVLDSTPDPADALETKQARALVLAALERVPLNRRAVLVMHDLDGVPMVDVAATLSIPLFTAYSRLRKARKELESAIRRFVREDVRR